MFIKQLSSFPRCKRPGAIWTKLADHSESSTHPKISNLGAQKNPPNWTRGHFGGDFPYCIITVHLFVDDVVWDCYTSHKKQSKLKNLNAASKLFSHLARVHGGNKTQSTGARIALICDTRVLIVSYVLCSPCPLQLGTQKGVLFCEHLPWEVCLRPWESSLPRRARRNVKRYGKSKIWSRISRSGATTMEKSYPNDCLAA